MVLPNIKGKGHNLDPNSGHAINLVLHVTATSEIGLQRFSYTTPSTTIILLHLLARSKVLLFKPTASCPHRFHQYRPCDRDGGNLGRGRARIPRVSPYQREDRGTVYKELLPARGFSSHSCSSMAIRLSWSHLLIYAYPGSLFTGQCLADGF